MFNDNAPFENQQPFEQQQTPNFTYTSLSDEIKQSREQALENNLAGAPITPDVKTTITSATDAPEITDSFTQRDEVMARLGLMKEDYSYSDTYTNYIQNGGTPLPGYEAAHTEILAQERAEHIFKLEEQGDIDHDTALMEAYGRDILATMGYDVTSVAYWQNKFLNNDFSHPFSNRYLMDQVLTAAEEYKKTREASEWGKSDISKTQLANLAGEELDAKQVKQIFGDIGKYAEEQRINDEELMRQCLSGSIAVNNRIRQIDETHFAILHTDGKLHILEKGKDIIFDEKGNIKEISINGSDAGDFIDHFASSFLSIIPTVVKIGHLFESIPDIITGNMDGVIERLEATDAWFNSEAPLADLHRLDHIDLDGFSWEIKDISMLTADILGMLAGSKLAGTASKAGAALGDTMAKSTLGYLPGKALKWTTSLGARSTGWFSGVENPEVFTIFGLEALGPSKASLWLNHLLKVTPVYAMKDFNQAVQAMSQANISLMLQGKDPAFTDNDIRSRALMITAGNYVFNALFSSAQGTTAMERYGLNKQTAAWQKILLTNEKWREKLQAASNVSNTALKNFMLAPCNIIGFNSFSDMFATLAGNQIQAYGTATTKDGKIYSGNIIDFLAGDDELGGEYGNNVILRTSFWKDIVQTGIMQIPEYARNKKTANTFVVASMDVLKEVNTEILEVLTDSANDPKDPDSAETSKFIKDKYLNKFNSTKGTVEEKILAAMDDMCENYGDMPPMLKRIFESKIGDHKKAYFNAFKQVIDYGIKYYAKNAGARKLDASGSKNYLKNTLKESVLNFENYLKGKTSDDKNAKFILLWNSLANKTIENFYMATGFNRNPEKLSKLITPENIDFSDSVEIVQDYTGKRISESYNDGAYTVYRIKNEVVDSAAKDTSNPKLKSDVFKTTMELLAAQMPDVVIKVDDNTFAMFNGAQPVTELTALTAQANLNHGIFSLKDQPVEASEIIISTFMGDTDYTKVENFEPYYKSLLETLDHAVKNKVITAVEATEVLKQIVEYTDTKDKNLSAFANKFNKYAEDVILNDMSRKTKAEGDDIEQTYRLRHAFITLAHESPTSDKFHTALNYVIDTKGTQDLYPDARQLLDYLVDHKLMPKDQLAAINQALLKDGNGIPLVGEARIDELLQQAVDSSTGAKRISDNEGRAETALYSKNITTVEDKKVIKAFLLEHEETIKDYENNVTHHECTGEIVVLDLAGLGGKATHRLSKEVEAKAAAKQKGQYIDKDIPTNAGVIKENQTKADIVSEYGKSTLVFDLTNTQELNSFKDVAKRLKIFGDTYDYDNADAGDISRQLKTLKDGWDNDIEYNDGVRQGIKLKEALQQKIIDNIYGIKWEELAGPLEAYTPDGKKHPYDIPTKVKQATRIHNVSKNVKVSQRKGLRELLISPFKRIRKGSSSYVGDIEAEEFEGVAKTATGNRAHEKHTSYQQVADDYEMDNDLGTYYYIRNLIDKANPQTYVFSYYGNAEAWEKILTDIGVLGEQGFYEKDTVATKDGQLTIRLKDNTNGKMLDYLETTSGDDFNLFRIIPLISEKPSQTSAYLNVQSNDGTMTYINNDGEQIIVHIPDMYNGQNIYTDTGIQIIMEITNGFDSSGTGHVKGTVLGGLYHQNELKDYFFNPFEHKLISSPKLKQEIYDAYTNGDIATLASYQDYEAIYLRNLLETQQDFIQDSIDEDYKVLLQEDEVVRYLQDNFNTHTNEFKVSLEELKEGVKNAYIQAVKKNYSLTNESGPISYNFNKAASSTRNETDDPYAYAVNSTILSNLSGTGLTVDLEDLDNAEYIDTIVSDAISNFKTIASADYSQLGWDMPGAFAIAYSENPVARVLQGIVGNQGYIKPEDAEEIANFTDEQMNLLADKLGLTQKEAQQIKTVAEELFEIQKKMIENENSKTREFKQNPYGFNQPSVSETGKTVGTKDGMLNELQNDLIKHHNRRKENNRKINLEDAYYDDYKDTINAVRNEAPDPESYAMSYFNESSDDQIRKHYDNPHSAEIYNIENIFGTNQMIHVRMNTLGKVEQITDNKDAQANIVDDMYYSAIDFTGSKEWYKYKIYDEKGNDILNTSYSGYNFFEFYRKLNDIKLEEGKTLTFVSLERQDIDSYGGIDFKYNKLDESTLNEIKTYFLINAIDSYRRFKEPTKDFQTFRNDLQSMWEKNPEEYNNLIFDLTISQLSKKTENEITIQNMAPVLGLDEEQVRNAIVPSILNSRKYGNEGVINYIKTMQADLDSDNKIRVSNAGLAIFGTDINALTEDNIRDLRISRDSLLSKIGNSLTEEQVENATNIAGYNLTSEDFNKALEKVLTSGELTQEQAIDFLKVIIASSEDASCLAYRTSGVFLDTLSDRDRLRELSLPIIEFTDSEGVEGIMKMSELNLHNMMFIDLEGIVPDKEVLKTGTLKDIFQASFQWYNEETQQWEHKTIFITHDGANTADAIATWAEAHKLNNNSYYTEEEGYKSAVDQYMKMDSSNGAVFMSEENFIKYLETIQNKTMVAYNGSGYDFQYLMPYTKNGNLMYLDGTVFNNMSNTGDSINRNRLANVTIDTIEDIANAHNAEADTDVLRRWVEDRFTNYIDPTVDSKQRIVRFIDGYLRHIGITDESALKDVYNQIDATFKELYNEGDFGVKFKQGMPDASTTTYVLRQINHRRSENLGYVLRNFINNPELFISTGFTGYQDEIRSGDLQRNVINAVAEKMMDNPDMTALAALEALETDIRYKYRQENGNDAYVDPLSVLSRYEVSDEKINSEEFNNIRNQLLKKKQPYGSKYSFVNSVADYERNKKWNIASRLIYSTDKMLKGFKFEDDNLKEAFTQQYLTLLSSTKEGLEQFDVPTQIVVKSHSAEQAEDMLSAAFANLKGIMFFKQRGAFKRVLQMPVGLFNNFTPSKYNPNTGYFEADPDGTVENLSPNTIVMDRRAVSDMCRQNYESFVDENGDMYVTVLRYPSAYRGSKHYFKVQVVEGQHGDVWVAPIVWRTLFAGDFDGDSASIVPVDTELSRALAKFSTDNLFATLNIQEELYNALTGYDLGKGGYVFKKDTSKEVRNDLPDILELSTNEDIIKVSKKIEKALYKNDNYKNLSDDEYNNYKKQFIDVVERVQMDKAQFAKLDPEDVWKVIGVHRGPNYAYIRNSTLLGDRDSKTFLNAVIPNMYVAAERTSKMESMAGSFKEYFMYPEIIKEHMEIDPLKKIDLFGTRIGEELGYIINTVDWTESKDGIKNYFDTIINTAANDKALNVSYISKLTDSIRDITTILNDEMRQLEASGVSRKDINQAISDKVYATTYQILENITMSLKDNAELNSQLSNILQTIDPTDNSKEQLEEHIKLHNMYKELSGRNLTITGDSITYGDDAALQNMLVDKINKNLDKRNHTKFVKDMQEITGNNNLVDVAVVTSRNFDKYADTLFIDTASDFKHTVDVVEISRHELEELYKVSTLVDNNNELSTVYQKLKGRSVSNMSDQEMENILTKNGISIYQDPATKTVLKSKKMLLQDIIEKQSENKENRLVNLQNAFGTITKDNKKDYIDIIKEMPFSDKKAQEHLLNIIKNIQDNQTIRIASNLSKTKRVQILLQEPVTGKKMLALSKGTVQSFSNDNKEKRFDILMGNKMLSKIDKLSPTSSWGSIENFDNVTVTINGEVLPDLRVKVFKDVPAYILENFNPDVDGKEQKSGIMEVEANAGGLEELGEYGTILLNKNGDEIDYSNKMLSDLVQENNDSHDIAWANAMGLALIGRNVALERQIVNKGLLPKLNYYLKEKYNSKVQFQSGKDIENYLTHFASSSLYVYNVSEVLTEFLVNEGYSKEDLLKNMTDQERVLFSKDVQDVLDMRLYGRVWNVKNPWLHSKSSAHNEVTPFRILMRGERIATDQENYTGHDKFVTQEYFYMPMNKFHALFNDGIGINRQDALDLTKNQIVSYATHMPASYVKYYAPYADTRYAVPVPDYTVPNTYARDPKSGTITNPDMDVVLADPGEVFRMNVDNMHSGPYVEDKPTGALNMAYLKNNRQHLDYLKTHQRHGLLLNSLINKDNIVDALIEASRRNIASEIVFEAWTQKERYTDNGVELTMNPETKTGTFSYLTGAGTDFILGKRNYYSYKDIYNKMDTKEKIQPKEIPNIKGRTTIDKGALADALSHNTDALTKMDSRIKMNSNIDIQFEYGRNDVDAFKNSYFHSSGIKITHKDKGDTIAVAMALESALGDSNAIIANGDEYLTNIRRSLFNYDSSTFQDYCTYEGIAEMEANGEDISEMLNYIGKSKQDYETTMKQNHDLLAKDPTFMSALNEYINYREGLNKAVAELYNDPFANLPFSFLSFVPDKKHQALTNQKVRNAIISSLNFKQYNPKNYHKELRANMAFNFFEANKSMHREIAKLLSVQHVQDALLSRDMISNVELINNIHTYLDNELDLSKMKIDTTNPEAKEIHQTIINIVRSKTDVNVGRALKTVKGTMEEEIRGLWNATKYRIEELQEDIRNRFGSNMSYSDLNTAIISGKYSQVDKDLLQSTFDTMTAQILLAQRITEISPDVIQNIEGFLNSSFKNGYVLVNKQGQRISRDSVIKPIGNLDSGWMVENIEKTANSQSTSKFNQYVIEKALRGELFLAKADLADTLEKNLYTTKVPSTFERILRKISSVSASIQMAMPLKMMSRVARFTGTDYMLGATYSLKTIPNMARAAKELSAAIYSKGATIKPGSDLYEYLKIEGQPLNATNKEPITFQEDIPSVIGQITDKMTKPLAYQNHLGRYAIWLTAKESFDNGDPIYGPAYHLHDQIDSLTKVDPNTGEVVPDNAAKALFIMDYMIGSPGGFPALSKKTNGYMMFATFPMNLTRTAGAYGMSLGTLFREGITADNAPQWMRTVVSPSAAVIIMGALGSALIDSMCEKYGIDEETKKKWKEEQVAIDPLGTILGGEPSVVYDSLNPLNQLKEMYLNPWISEYNKNLGEKALGFASQNFIGKLNPALKTPIELLTQRDFQGSSAIDTSQQYTRYENGLRKVLGYLAGSGVANGIMDQFKIDKNNKDATFIDSLRKGILHGFSNDLGNQKSWKKDISNYYSMINRLSSYKYAKGSSYKEADYEDLTDLNYMKEQRSYLKSYGDYDADDYARVNKMLKKMINNRENPTTIYTYIAEEYNNGTSEATLRRALNNNSLIRKLNTLDKKDFYRTLTTKEVYNLERALEWEKETYPLLKDFFPANSYYNYKLPYRKKYYSNSGKSSYYPKSVSPKRAPTPYAPDGGYSSTYGSTYKKKYNPERVEVNVSPQMGIWVKDYNKITDLNHWTNNTYQKQKPLKHGGGK